MKYQCWKDKNSITFAQKDSIVWQRENGLLELDAVFQYEIEAEDYNDAMQQHHDRQGWGKYHPMED